MITKEILEKELDSGLLAKDIAVKYNISTAWVSKLRKKYNILKDISKNYINKQFGELTVKKRLKNNKHMQHMWLCLCSCGKYRRVSGESLSYGYTKSCGCIKKRERAKGKNNYQWSGFEEISGTYWNSIKNSAKIRNINFDITIEYAWNLYIQQNKKCNYTNLDICFAKSKKKMSLATASLDRIDNNKGYIEGNIQWIHKDINWMKRNFSEDVFINYCKLIVKNKGKTL